MHSGEWADLESAKRLATELEFFRRNANEGLQNCGRRQAEAEWAALFRQVMASERPYVVPLMAEFNATRQKLEVATRSTYPDQKQIRSLALAQARLLTKLVAEDTDLQRKISQLLNSEQRRKVEKLNQANEVSDLRDE
jgi:putative protein kinase ArgK-like GTPase of G3E family